MRTFKLVRTTDVSGVSGTGIVAEGVEFSSGKCSLAWVTQYRSVAVYDSIHELEAIHGHDGATVIEWDTDSTLARIEATQRDILARLPESAPPVPQPPATPAPPTPEPAYIVNETWKGATLHKGTPETAPKLPLVWIQADDPTPQNADANLVTDELLGNALEIAVTNPTWGTTYGDRVFPTVESRWEVFKPCARQEMWISAPFRFTTPVKISNRGGANEWLSALLQAKSGDRTDVNALFQMNLKPEGSNVRLWCVLPYGTEREIAPFYLPPTGEPFIVTLRYRWSSDATGGFDLYLNGRHCWTGTGRTGHKMTGYGNFAPLVYGNIFDAPVTMRVGGFRVSAERIP